MTLSCFQAGSGVRKDEESGVLLFSSNPVQFKLLCSYIHGEDNLQNTCHVFGISVCVLFSAVQIK